MSSIRVAKVLCSFDLLSAIFSGQGGVEPGACFKTTAPDDLKVVGISSVDHIDNTAWLYCQSTTFAPVGWGEEPPQIDPIEFEISHKEVGGETSDGYHTFNELYEHRHALFINVVLAHHDIAFKTWKNDKGEVWDGWFILGMNTAYGQITYHLPESYWERIPVNEVERNSDYDGHTDKDVLERLNLLAINEFEWGR